MNYAVKKAHIGIRVRTGDTCPESGVWGVEGYPTTTAPIAKGNRMPPYRGISVFWVLWGHVGLPILVRKLKSMCSDVQLDEFGKVA